MFIKLILSKQLTINKCTLLDCINTEILMYCIYLQYTPSVRYSLYTLFWYRHTHMTFPPPAPSTLEIICCPTTLWYAAKSILNLFR